jgi:predicted metalloendopeptidase
VTCIQVCVVYPEKHYTDCAGSLIADDVESTLKRIVNQDESKLASKDLPLQKKTKQAFDACMDKAVPRKTGLKPLKELVDHIKEIMPTTSVVRDGARRLKQTAVTLRKVNGLDEALAFLKRLNTDALIKFDVIVSCFLSSELH